MKKVVLIVTSCVILECCIITDTPGFYSGYSKLSSIEKENVIFTDSNFHICNIVNDEKIYAINGIQLSHCLSKIDKSIVYFWTPNCNSEKCYPIQLVQDFCNNNEYTLFVITEYYDFIRIDSQNQQLSPLPMFSINEKYYLTKYCNKYIKLFINDLLKTQDYNRNDIYSRFFIFEKGILVSNSLELKK